MKTINTQSWKASIHKIYLILAITIGFTLSIFMPLFSEPDGQYHFMLSAYIAGKPIDSSRYSEAVAWTGMNQQINFYRTDSRFEEYFLQKAEKIDIGKVPKAIGFESLTSKLRFNLWGHLVPAIGVWFGYHIYPSLGVMATVGRIFSMLVHSLAMYYIIRSVKKGKMIFFVVSLCPVIINTFASLSYDSTSYVLVAALIAFYINLYHKEKVEKTDIRKFIFFSLLMLVSVKFNFLPLLLIGPMILIEKQTMNEVYSRILLNKRKFSYFVINNKKSLLILILTMSFLVFLIFSINYGGPITLFTRLFLNYFINFNYNPVLDLNASIGDITSIFVQPYATFNFIPVWVSCLYYAVILSVLYTDDPMEVSLLFRTVTVISLIVCFFGTITAFLKTGTNIVQGIGGSNAIIGIQGRYMTPYVLLFPLIFAVKGRKINIQPAGRVMLFSISVIILSNAMLLFNTLYAIYYMGA
ncbi:MAG: DUF2142 domain-containing protein [Lactovum sp.]